MSKFEIDVNTPRKNRKRGFTLLEVLVAIGLLVYLMLQVAGANSGAIFFSRYSKNMIVATYLARGKMTELEMLADSKPLKELLSHKEDGKFEEHEGFTFEVKFRQTKLVIPIPKEKIKEDMIMQQLNQFFEGELFAEAIVQISWEEGKRTKKMTVRRLFTNWDYVKEYETSMSAMMGGLGQ